MVGTARHSAEPNVTPMIDVLLVLLITFMVVVVQGRRTMDVQLAEPRQTPTTELVPIVLEVVEGGAYRLNQKPVEHAALLGVLTETYRDRADKVLSVAGRPGVRYAEVMEAMDVARSAGVNVLSVVPKGF